MEFTTWKKKAAKLARTLAGVSDILDEDDPYDLEEAMQDAFDEDMTPEEFVEEHFGDDIASRAAEAADADEGIEEAWEDEEIDSEEEEDPEPED